MALVVSTARSDGARPLRRVFQRVSWPCWFCPDGDWMLAARVTFGLIVASAGSCRAMNDHLKDLANLHGSNGPQ